MIVFLSFGGDKVMIRLCDDSEWVVSSFDRFQFDNKSGFRFCRFFFDDVPDDPAAHKRRLHVELTEQTKAEDIEGLNWYRAKQCFRRSEGYPEAIKRLMNAITDIPDGDNNS